MHGQEGKEGNIGDGRTMPLAAHHPSGFIVAKITSASKLGLRPLLTTLIISWNRDDDWVEGGVMATHAITQAK